MSELVGEVEGNFHVDKELRKMKFSIKLIREGRQPEVQDRKNLGNSWFSIAYLLKRGELDKYKQEIPVAQAR